MGFIPIFLMIAAFFGLWSGVIYATFSQNRRLALAAQAARALVDTQAWQALSMADLLAQGRAGQRDSAAWQAEYTFRVAVFRYHRLLQRPPYSLFARWFGFKKIAA